MNKSRRLYSPRIRTNSSVRLTVAVLLTAVSHIYSPQVFSNGGIMPDDYPGAALINEGRRLFFNETFGGNGRTCGVLCA